MNQGTEVSPDNASAVVDQYRRRDQAADAHRYSVLNPSVWQVLQERQRAMYRLFRRLNLGEFSRLTLVEVGCGEGGNLLDFLRMGFAPENICGIDLLPERLVRARRVLPAELTLLVGDAATLNLPDASRDIVLQSVVFSSVLDRNHQRSLAASMWRWLRPGGGVLWYDFIYNNPRNPDVRGIPLCRVRELFPEGRISSHKVTLAPPLTRFFVNRSPWLYHFLNMCPLLRTHVLCWIEKS